jgi:hypothetical protein
VNVIVDVEGTADPLKAVNPEPTVIQVDPPTPTVVVAAPAFTAVVEDDA